MNVGDVVRLSKPHACGGYDWAVMRVGADVGMKCEKCGRRVMMERPELERRVKDVVSRGSIDSR